VDETDDGIKEDGDVRSEWEGDEGTDSEGGDSDGDR